MICTCRKDKLPGVEGGSEEYSVIFHEVLLQPLIAAGGIVQGDVKPRPGLWKIVEKPFEMVKEGLSVVGCRIRNGRGVEGNLLARKPDYAGLVGPI